jgi:hypothetical protein
MRTNPEVANWPPSDPIFLDIYCHVPGPQPLFQALICQKTLTDEFDRLALDLPDKFDAYCGRIFASGATCETLRLCARAMRAARGPSSSQWAKTALLAMCQKPLH